PLDLDDDVLAGPQGGRVDLRDRRRRDRGLVEAREDFVEGSPEVLLDDAPHDVERLGAHLVATEPELGDELFGKDALARREDLPELDVGRPEVLEGAPEATAEPGARRGVALAALDGVPEAEGGAEA